LEVVSECLSEGAPIISGRLKNIGEGIGRGGDWK